MYIYIYIYIYIYKYPRDFCQTFCKTSISTIHSDGKVYIACGQRSATIGYERKQARIGVHF